MKVLSLGQGKIGNDLRIYNDKVASSKFVLDPRSHSEELNNVGQPDLVIVTGGLTMPEVELKSFAGVIEANQEWPVRVARHFTSLGIPVVVLSSSGVYKRVASSDQLSARIESDEVRICNQYTASKIGLELALGRERGVYIARIPTFIPSFDDTSISRLTIRMKLWEVVEDSKVSWLTSRGLHYFVNRVLDVGIDGMSGVYNVAEGFCSMQEIVRNLTGETKPTVEHGSLGLTPLHVLDCSRALHRGFLPVGRLDENSNFGK